MPTSQAPATMSAPTPAPSARRTRHAGLRVLGLARLLIGLFFVTAGVPKLTDHATASANFAAWHVPLHDLAAYGIGGLEVVGGALLVLGRLTRPVALLLLADMAGAVLFAGTTDGGQHLVLPVVLGVLCARIASPVGDSCGRPSRVLSQCPPDLSSRGRSRSTVPRPTIPTTQRGLIPCL